MDIKPENPDEDNKLNSCDHHIEKCKRYVFHMVFQRAGQFVTSVSFHCKSPYGQTSILGSNSHWNIQQCHKFVVDERDEWLLVLSFFHIALKFEKHFTCTIW